MKAFTHIFIIALIPLYFWGSTSVAKSELTEEGQKVQPSSYHDIFSDSKDFNRPKTEELGPFRVSIAKNQIFTLGPMDQISSDMFVPDQYGKSPLVIILHGNKFSKELHQLQAEYLASWGIHVLTLDLPNEKEWLLNGHRTKKMVSLIRSVPSLVSPNIDISKIILVGHSFGGSAVTIAAGQGARVAGLVLLDPAVVSEEIYGYQKSIQVPVVLLGADKAVFKSRYRATFSRNIPSPFFEVSVLGADHTDAHLSKKSIFWRLSSDEDRMQRKDIFKKLILESTISILENDFVVLSERVNETSKNSKVQIRIDHWQR